MKPTRLALLVALLSVGVQAQVVSDINCRNRSGMRINSSECIGFLKAQQPLSEVECIAAPGCIEQVDARARARREYWAEQDRKEQEGRDRAEDVAERKVQQAAAIVKTRCGADYKAPRIGMSIARAQECVTPMQVTGQINRADGIVTTYRGGGGSYFHAMNGVIVSWSK